jgi:hypothetical protein
VFWLQFDNTPVFGRFSAMSIAVLLEPLESGYRATCGQPLVLSAEAPSRDEAVVLLRQKIEERLANGAEIVDLELLPRMGQLQHWLNQHNAEADDELFSEWDQAVSDYRDRIENEANAL